MEKERYRRTRYLERKEEINWRKRIAEKEMMRRCARSQFEEFIQYEWMFFDEVMSEQVMRSYRGGHRGEIPDKQD